jgi:hypothetical protein
MENAIYKNIATLFFLYYKNVLDRMGTDSLIGESLP